MTSLDEKLLREERAERLRFARERAKFRGPTSVAKELGMSVNTYKAYEQGRNGFGLADAERFANLFGVSLQWLNYGEGSPDDANEPARNEIPIMGYLGAGAEVMPEFEQVPPEGLDQIEVPFPLPAEMIAFKVRGDSMLPVYKDGAVIIVYRDQQRPLHAFYGEEAAVRTSDGRRFIKTVMRGRDGLVNLLSWNAPPIEDVHLEWVGEIFATLPGSTLRKVERQGGIQGQLKLGA